MVLLYSHATNSPSLNKYQKEAFPNGETTEKSYTNWDHYCKKYWTSIDHNLAQALLQNNPFLQQLWKLIIKPNVEFKLDWTHFQEVSLAVRKLIKYQCHIKKQSCSWCNCVQSAHPCTKLCKCNGNCERE